MTAIVMTTAIIVAHPIDPNVPLLYPSSGVTLTAASRMLALFRNSPPSRVERRLGDGSMCVLSWYSWSHLPMSCHTKYLLLCLLMTEVEAYAKPSQVASGLPGR
eukprot:scaffold228340_cov31-Tisochrysis_lutea.AAC.1